MINVGHLKQKMEEYGMSRRDFCRKGHVEESSICRLFKGERAGSLGFLEGIARCFPDEDLRSFLILEEEAGIKYPDS